MARFSSRLDVKDPLIQGVSQEADHQEAQRTIEMELRRRGIDPEEIEEEFLKDLSVNYACWRRCLYEVQAPDDPWSAKKDDYKRLYDQGIRILDKFVATGAVSSGGRGAYCGTITVRR